MGGPDDADLALAAQQALGLSARPRIAARSILHAAPGRAAERVDLGGRVVAVKWRDDRPTDREALLYRGLSPTVLRALGAPVLLGATTVAGTHLLFLQWVEGVPANWQDPEHVRLAFGHLGRVHALTAGLLAGPAEALATSEAWGELLADRRAGGGSGDDPLVLDPGDLHADNFLMLGDGSVCLLDFENMAVRTRARALHQLWDDGSLPQGELADLALSTYWAAAGWSGDAGTFQARVL